MNKPQDLLGAALADRYRIERELGRGGMAAVYLTRDLKHDRLVALKVMHPELAQASGPERFLREVRTTARLQHPHILPLLDSGNAAGLLWYTMPFVEGESLRERLRREVQLPLPEAQHITLEVANALHYAHEHGIVHRDVKPENILLAGGHALVADFGVARALEAAGDGERTATGIALGTPAYMSPEQASGGVVDARSDIYALGAVLYEMLAGEPPYTGPTPQAILARRMLNPIPRVCTVREGLPAAVDEVLARALAKVPADRYRTAAELTHALERVTSADASLLEAPPAPIALRRSRRRRWLPVVFGLGATTVLAAIGLFPPGRFDDSGPGATRPRMLAVLPFENLGSPEDAYFADGLTEEITSRLAGMKDLGVISRTSAMQYKGVRKPLREIARELGVAYVLEGSVRWDKTGSGASRIRVTPQLIQVEDDRHLWADRYDAELVEVFEVQSTIAERVAEALDLALNEPEREALAAVPTKSLRAYDYFLRGNELFRRAEVSGWSLPPREFEPAVDMYSKAIEVDPGFALAYARLGRTHLELHRSYTDESPRRLTDAKAAIDEAIRLDPGLPEARLAKGAYLMYGERDYSEALRELSLAAARQPGNAEALSWIAWTWRAQSQFDSSIVYWRRAADLDPRSARIALEAAWTLLFVRDYPEAERHLQRASAIAPEWIGPAITSGLLYLDWRGDSARARVILRDALLRLGIEQAAQFPLFPLDHLTSDTMIAPALDTLPVEAFGGDTTFFYVWKAYWHRLRGRPALERAYSDSARPHLEIVARRYPDAFNYRHYLALVYAGMGRKTAALREAQRGVAIADSTGAWADRADARFLLALVATRFGEREAAVARLTELMQLPSQYSPNFLRVYPGFAPLRGHPAFERLIAESVG